VSIPWHPSQQKFKKRKPRNRKVGKNEGPQYPGARLSDRRGTATSYKVGADTYIVKPVDFQNLSEVTPQLSLRWALLKPRTTLRA